MVQQKLDIYKTVGIYHFSATNNFPLANLVCCLSYLLINAIRKRPQSKTVDVCDVLSVHIIIIIIIIMRVLPKGGSFTPIAGTKVVVLSKDRSSTVNSGTKVAVLLEMNKCGSFLLLSAPHSLFSI